MDKYLALLETTGDKVKAIIIAAIIALLGMVTEDGTGLVGGIQDNLSGQVESVEE
jgi:hypothetical protein